LWDNLDNLKDLFDKNSENFDFLYNFHLRQILVTYSKFLRTEIPPYSRLVEFFTNEKFREEYKFAEFPDKKFSRLFVKCLKSEGRNEKMKVIEKLTNHVLEKMHGFNIDGWKIRTKLEIS